MKLTLTIILFLIPLNLLFSQETKRNNTDSPESDSVFIFDSYTVKVNNGLLKVIDGKNKILYTRKFASPNIYIQDLDADSVDEFIVVDNDIKNNIDDYTVYIYDMKDNFTLTDSVSSGITEPDVIENAEVNSFVIIAGNTTYDFLNRAETANKYSPINCYVYENSELFDVNNEIYDVFIKINEQLTNDLDEYTKSNKLSCLESTKYKALIAEIFINFLQAQEKSMAQKFIDNYYKCDDKDKFVNELIKLMDE